MDALFHTTWFSRVDFTSRLHFGYSIATSLFAEALGLNYTLELVHQVGLATDLFFVTVRRHDTWGRHTV